MDSCPPDNDSLPSPKSHNDEADGHLNRHSAVCQACLGPCPAETIPSAGQTPASAVLRSAKAAATRLAVDNDGRSSQLGTQVLQEDNDEHTFSSGIRPKSIRKPRDLPLAHQTASKRASKRGDVRGQVSSPDERG